MEDKWVAITVIGLAACLAATIVGGIWADSLADVAAVSAGLEQRPMPGYEYKLMWIKPSGNNTSH